MRIALLGYGKMGQMIERIAVERGHEIVLKVDEHNDAAANAERLRMADVAIEFSIPSAAVDNYKWCFDLGIPVVSGTTGWLDRWEEVIEWCLQQKGAFFYASNFSIGVNLFFQLNQYLAKLMSRFDAYKVFVEETHHIHKLDAPSGTAITLANGIIDQHEGYDAWQLGGEVEENSRIIPITAKREGEVPGIHTIWYKSKMDEIEIKHAAFSREGFALGAVLAAEFLKGRTGIFGMKDILQLEQMV